METKVKSELEAIITGRSLPEGHHYQSLGDIIDHEGIGRLSQWVDDAKMDYERGHE